MFYVYVLQSEIDGRYYVGQTDNLKERFYQHNKGESRYTRKFKPWKLIYYEAYQSRKLAIRRERKLKPRAKAWQELLKRLASER